MTKIPVMTVRVSRSRKLVLAAALVGGGYGAALILGSLSESLLPAAKTPAASDAEAGWLATLRGFVQSSKRTAATGKLVPLSDTGPGFTGGSLTPAPRLSEQPTWLVATSPADSPRIASRPEYAAPPTISANRPIGEATSASGVASHAQPEPKARITNVTAVTPQANSRAASPWDRWPRWTDSDAAEVNRPVAATFQDTSSATSRPMQTTFSDNEIVRKNSPPLDPGHSAERSGRTHIVVDGDSLSRLAERYLDDPAMGVEIYRLNRDVLNDPELLPIGVELRIPDDRVAELDAGIPNAGSFAAAKPSAPRGMVPVEWTPRAFDGSPRAELLRPIPTGRSD